jgi:hypothetical protein
MDSLENHFAERRETPERFPSKEEIDLVFKKIVKGRQYTELRTKSVDGVVRLYEIEVFLENGERVECNYQIANYDFKNIQDHPWGIFSASIHIILYDITGEPTSGKPAANYINGVWTFAAEAEGIF